MQKIYAASRASIVARGKMWRDYRDKGSLIVSSWIDAKEELTTEFLTSLWSKIEQEIKLCDILVLYVSKEDFPLKGAFIEVGMAIALGKPVFIKLHDVDLNPVNFNPLGSWAAHPSVTFINHLDEIMFK